MNKNINQAILEELQKIPRGKVMTYKTMADRFGVHPRKVAMVMKYNKHPDIYPCYKVISHSGKISGYSAESGVAGKKAKLEADGIIIENDFIDKKYVI